MQRNHFAMNGNSQVDEVALCNNLSKAFDRVLQFDLIKNIAGMGVGGCMLEILFDYFVDRSQVVRVGTSNST